MSALVPVLCTSVFAAAGVASVATIVHTIKSSAERIITVLETGLAIEREGRAERQAEAKRRVTELSADGAAVTAALLTVAHQTIRTRMLDEGPSSSHRQFQAFLREAAFQNGAANLEQLMAAE